MNTMSNNHKIINNMLLIDSIYINIGGGKILLDYLVSELERNKFDVFYLFDSRCEKEYSNVPSERKLYLKAGIFNRYLFYKNNKGKFSKVLCFGNVPPPINLTENSIIYTYFHQPLFIGDDKPRNLFKRLIVFSKTSYINFVKKNTNYWFVQNTRIKNGLIRKYNVPSEQIKILPFFSPLPASYNKKEKNSFAYISTAPPHKNHLRLIKAWELLHDEGINPKLHLTVPEGADEVYNRIIRAKLNGVNIENHGYITRNEVSDILHGSQFLIFPSLAESFGLPLLEGIEAGCKVIASDLEYTYQVIKPSHSFNPFSCRAIADAVKFSLENDLPPSKPKVKNEIKELFKLLEV